MRSRAVKRALALAAFALAVSSGCSEPDGNDRVERARGPGEAPARPAIVAMHGDATAFERVETGRVRAVIAPERLRRTRHAVTVELPEQLGAPALVALAGTDMSLALTLLGTTPAAGEARDGAWLHRGGAPGGGDVLWRPSADGVEDHVSFAARPVREELRYRLKLAGVAGLRLIAGSLELLAADGSPGLRMGRPWVLDRDGRTHFATVSLAACNVDTDPRAPWGRPPVPPGSDECELSIDWSGAGVTYPAVVDPAWTSTGKMAEAREEHGAALLNDGRVLVAGGWRSGTTATAEIFDPATSTFASTSSMSLPRRQMGFERLPNGKVLTCGSYTTNTSEIWDPATGLWTAAGNMAVARGGTFATVSLTNGKVLVTGGATSLVSELFDPTTNTFTPTGSMNVQRSSPFAGARLKDGRVFVVGGWSGSKYTPTGEIYDPVSATWTLTASMKFGRSEHLVFVLNDGRVLVPGGVEDDAIKYSDIYDPTTNTWSPTPNLTIARRYYAGGALKDGRVLLVGGEVLLYPFYTEKTEIFDPAANTWTAAASMSEGRYVPSFTLLNDGSVLVAGGYSDLVGYLNTAEVFRLQPDGASCGGDLDCTSQHCVDGVCCATTCGQPCQACSAALKESGASGTCGPAKNGTAEPTCAATAGAPCGYVGTCNGQGGCAFAAQGAGCGAKQCSAGAVTTFACNGQGACAQTPTSCAPYVCATATSCAAACSSDAGCVAAAWCGGGICKPDLDAGSACSAQSQCKSGFCVDGVCCDKACTGACEACSLTKKGSGADGVCQPVKAGTDPNAGCPDDGAASCQRDGACDGAGACRLYAAGLGCAAPGCQGNQPSTSACDGKGTCVAALGPSCGAYVCSAAACTSSCSTDAECSAGSKCASGSCVALSALGAKCAQAGDCASGQCVDGYCCDAACGGQCEACDVQGGEGHCVPAAGKPHGGRPACATGDAANPCSAAACDGIERASCLEFVGSSVACRTASCSGGVATLVGVCAGDGKCGPVTTRDCAPYTCAGDVCSTSCSSDTECVSPSVCDVATGKCVTPNKCVGDTTLESPNGSQVDCSPFRCQNAGCLTSCKSLEDCAASYVCSKSGVCQLPSSSGDSGDSSGCSIEPSRRAAPPWLMLGLTALAALSRRVSRGRRQHFAPATHSPVERLQLDFSQPRSLVHLAAQATSPRQT